MAVINKWYALDTETGKFYKDNDGNIIRWLDLPEDKKAEVQNPNFAETYWVGWAEAGSEDVDWCDGWDSFLTIAEDLIKKNLYRFYVHNLNFDSKGLLYKLMKSNDWVPCEMGKPTGDKSYLVLRSSKVLKVVLYKQYIRNKKELHHTIEFLDSNSIVRTPLKKLPASFGGPNKGHLDLYPDLRSGDLIPDDVLEYAKDDVRVLLHFVKYLKDNNIRQMTITQYAKKQLMYYIGVDAFEKHKDSRTWYYRREKDMYYNALSLYEKDKAERLACDMGQIHFRKIFPKLDYEMDKTLRKLYKGGFNDLSTAYRYSKAGEIIKKTEWLPKAIEILINNGFDVDTIRNSAGALLDFNSMYLNILSNYDMPCGIPQHYDGLYDDAFIMTDGDRVRLNTLGYKTFIQRVRFTAETIPGKVGFIFFGNEIGNYGVRYNPMPGQLYDMWLTEPDLTQLFECYDITNLEYIEGYAFKTVSGVFNSFVNHYYELKTKLSGARSVMTKLILTNIVGAFGSRTDISDYFIDETANRVRFTDRNEDKSDEETKKLDPTYVPVAAFCTAIGRLLISRIVNELGDRWIYSDTDSVYFTAGEWPTSFEIGLVGLGKMKIECLFRKGKFIMPKTYALMATKAGAMNENLEWEYRKEEEILKASGISSSEREYITYDAFKPDLNFNKFVVLNIEGGAAIINKLYTVGGNI